MIETVIAAAALSLSPIDVMERAARIPAAQHQFRDCVVERESRGNPRARNKNSSASGTYQFLDSQWREGLSYMVAERLRDYGYPNAGQLRRDLEDTPIHKWEPIFQDIGFAAVLNHDGLWSGWRHWAGDGSPCNRLVPGN